jgi:transcription initiation factor TFIIIB Brf1 subunit/transcription initiation factor TFIIB
MSNIYCSNCGSKHILGSKFCTNCGNSLGGFSNIAKPTLQQTIQPRNISRPQTRDVDEDGIPTTFVKPSRLSYEIEKPAGNKHSAKDLFNSAPVDPNERSISRLNSNYKKLTKEELLAQSLKECSSRQLQDIDEP